ncbi:hypothetical protein EA473_14900 [Natrarchaeobius chitinivorans]|uniref:Uncharacterized protein n=1 Tax=Natrarchaeobius chitinivorans TaxID=1679083 RepID=A0A3N6N5P1_NATCH|nr:hypothetical protein EA473_14900 [Natrarchaeobius chitinivorans]
MCNSFQLLLYRSVTDPPSTAQSFPFSDTAVSWQLRSFVERGFRHGFFVRLLGDGRRILLLSGVGLIGIIVVTRYFRGPVFDVIS